MMTVGELKDKLQYLDSDKVVMFVDRDGGWTNIEINMYSSADKTATVSIVPSDNTIFSEDK